MIGPKKVKSDWLKKSTILRYFLFLGYGDMAITSQIICALTSGFLDYFGNTWRFCAVQSSICKA